MFRLLLTYRLVMTRRSQACRFFVILLCLGLAHIDGAYFTFFFFALHFRVFPMIETESLCFERMTGLFQYEIVFTVAQLFALR